ncbi:clostripain-related cysteine peptidase [Nocardioides sp.]|uniref:clostripain-related cysteine peptidase n=1 Tax=Nocardioides sp. TaxID=35761 RepID=UPI0035658F9C
MKSAAPGRPTVLRVAAAGVVAALALTTVTAARSSAGPAVAPQRSAPAPAAGADWTVMVYDVADTSNIANDMIANLAAFTRLPEMANVNIVAMVDLPEKNDPGYPKARLPGIAPFTTTKLVVLEDGRWNELTDFGEVSMGRPDTLAGFIERVADRFPATNYGLVLSDHGGAWSGGYADTGPPSTSQLSIADMRAAIITGMQRGGIDRFAFIDHDSCLMSAYEAASALGPLADVIVGSEEVTFGDFTLDLDAMTGLASHGSGEQWGLGNIEGYAETADKYEAIGAFSVLSVVDGERMARLDAAVESFANVAVANMEAIAPELARARGRSLEFVSGLLGEEEGAGFSVVDLGDFLRQIKNVPAEVAVARDAVFVALDAAVLHQVTRRATKQATGLNVFFPETPRQARGYLAQRIAPPGWARFVEAYAEAADAIGSDGSARFTSDQARVVEINSDGIRIAGQLRSGDEANVADTETQVFTRLDGREVLAVALPGYLNSGGVGQVQGVWNYAVTTLVTGKRRAPASTVYQVQEGGLLGWFHALYSAPDGEETDVEIQVLLSSEGAIESVTVSDISLGQGATAGIELQNGGTLTPYFIVASSGGYQLELSSQSVPINNNTEVAYSRLAKGTAFDMGVGVADLAGNFETAFVSERVR